MRRVRLAVLGGTFDHLHAGHHALLATAFRVGRGVAIGLTTDRYVRDHPKPGVRAIQAYRYRRARLREWLSRNFPGREWRITPLVDGVGRSIELGVGSLIVSPETVAGGRAVNRARRHLGRPSVPLVRVPLVLGDDLRPVSSRRVRAGEITPEGRRRTAVRVGLEVDDPQDRRPAERAILRVFPRARIDPVLPPVVRRKARARRAGRPPLVRPGRGPDLSISIVRDRRSGWWISEASPDVRLPPRRVGGTRPPELERGLASALRPRLEHKFFPSLRSS